jgi:hypothetical protein
MEELSIVIQTGGFCNRAEERIPDSSVLWWADWWVSSRGQSE